MIGSLEGWPFLFPTLKNLSMNNTNDQTEETHRLTARNVDVELKQLVIHASNRHIEYVRLLNENSQLIRRYSFDDNGGGYAGL